MDDRHRPHDDKPYQNGLKWSEKLLLVVAVVAAIVCFLLLVAFMSVA